MRLNVDSSASITLPARSVNSVVKSFLQVILFALYVLMTSHRRVHPADSGLEPGEEDEGFEDMTSEVPGSFTNCGYEQSKDELEAVSI